MHIVCVPSTSACLSCGTGILSPDEGHEVVMGQVPADREAQRRNRGAPGLIGGGSLGMKNLGCD